MRKQPQSGFTLVELIMGSVIAAVLLGFIISVFADSSSSSQRTRAVSQAHQTIRDALTIIDEDLRQTNWAATTNPGSGTLTLAGSRSVTWRVTTDNALTRTDNHTGVTRHVGANIQELRITKNPTKPLITVSLQGVNSPHPISITRTIRSGQ